MTRRELEAAAVHPNMLAFLRMLRAGETDQTEEAYRMMFGRELFDVSDGWKHPRQIQRHLLGKQVIASSAAGAYQFLSKTWDWISKKHRIPDFSPASQDLAAVALIAYRGALNDVLEGRIHEAVRKCRLEWASLPGSPYGQPTKTLAKALAVYAEYSGEISEEIKEG